MGGIIGGGGGGGGGDATFDQNLEKQKALQAESSRQNFAMQELSTKQHQQDQRDTANANLEKSRDQALQGIIATLK